MKTITVTISGERGVGKSTLARILIDALANGVTTQTDELIPFERMDREELHVWVQRLFADTKVVFKTEQPDPDEMVIKRADYERLVKSIPATLRVVK